MTNTKKYQETAKTLQGITYVYEQDCMMNQIKNHKAIKKLFIGGFRLWTTGFYLEAKQIQQH